MRTRTLTPLVVGAAFALVPFVSFHPSSDLRADTRSPGSLGLHHASEHQAAAAPAGQKKQLREEPEFDVEKTFPDFTLQDLSGGQWRPARLKGKVTLINVWSST